ncbi:MAG: DUF1439 domain-containing protein [Burkholderiaceae bacterium]|nr:MAG: DUF1439 domain-containing protein [Burkholderiaceae bacterium]
MRRRLLIACSASLAIALTACAGGAGAAPRYTISAAQLEGAVAGKFPRRYPVAGLIDLNLQAPRLRLLPAQNRLGADMAVLASGPALRRSYQGGFDVDFGLRYEPSDRTIRATQLRVNALRLEGLQPPAAEMLNAYGPQLAEQSLRDVVLHQLREQDLAVADGLGLQPGGITVTAQGLVIDFVPKPR